MCLLNDGRLLTGSSDYKMKFWEEQDGKFVDSLTISEQVDSILCLCQLKDLRIISTSEEKGTIKIWNKVKNSETYKVTSLSEHESSITSLIQLPDGRLLTGSKDKTIIVISHRLENSDLFDNIYNLEEYEYRNVSKKFSNT